MPDTHAGRAGRRRDDRDAGGRGRRGRRRAAHCRGRESAPGLERQPSSACAGEPAPRRRRAALDGGRPTAPAPRLVPPPAALDRRLEEEFERARRYSLSFSLVLLDVDDARRPTTSDPDAEARQRAGARRPGPARAPPARFRLPLRRRRARDRAARDRRRRRPALASLRAAASGLDGVEPPGIVAYPHPAVTVPDDLFALVEAALRRGQAQSGERIGVAD